MPNRFLRVLRSLFLSGLLLTGAACSTKSPGPEIAPAETLQRVQDGGLTLVDIRRPEEWRETGVAKGALRIEMHDPAFVETVLKQVNGNRNAPIALICRSGHRSGQMQKSLLDQGFTQVFSVHGGMAGDAGWIKQGLPVIR
jgi:rhodanese-related sulfurtransferase